MSTATYGATIIVHDWHCQCSACGWGNHGQVIISGKPCIEQDSGNCPNCGAWFTGRRLSDSARQPAPNYLGDLG